ncbi:unnamed protein product [Cuscuta epithymum]|uniref:Uncharacterized protein n=1 Tax=Cuscuta epithymum TaxID=186058 RepID=A0AAV0ERS0_9ASTE|nr:unnamed protein product [Cuscuta epithymum]
MAIGVVNRVRDAELLEAMHCDGEAGLTHRTPTNPSSLGDRLELDRRNWQIISYNRLYLEHGTAGYFCNILVLAVVVVTGEGNGERAESVVSCCGSNFATPGTPKSSAPPSILITFSFCFLLCAQPSSSFVFLL